MSQELETLLTAARFRVARVAAPDVPSREVIRHNGAVAIVPLVDDERVCLIRNYRMAVDETLIELPAGTLEPNEEPLAAAERELAEETGFRARQVQALHSFYLSPGILDEKMHLFVARGLTPGPTALEPGEKIENVIVSFEEAISMVRDGTIQDAKTIVGLMWVKFFQG